MKSAWASKGFTIVELTISIVVIAILVTITVVSYSGFQERTRDSERTSDIAQLKIALDKYYAEESQYPAVCAGDDTACTVTDLADELEPYLPSIPTDPQGTTNEYEYIRGGTSGNAYAIKVNFEVEDECKTGVRVETDWWTSGVPVCD